MPIIKKVCPCILKKVGAQTQALVFEHPCGDFQLVKGTVEPQEDVEKAALRELLEEAGIREAWIVEKLGVFRDFVKPDVDEKEQEWEWHVFIVEPHVALPMDWHQQASGSAIENELVFRFFWQDLRGDYSNYHSCFLPVFELLESTSMRTSSFPSSSSSSDSFSLVLSFPRVEQ